MNETATLLKESSRGCKYATETIGIALEYVKEPKMRTLLIKYDKEHERLKGRIGEKIKEEGQKEYRHPNMGAAMAKLHMNMSLSVNPANNRVAAIMINGCNSGVKSIAKAKNRNPKASPQSRALADELIAMENEMAKKLLDFLI